MYARKINRTNLAMRSDLFDKTDPVKALEASSVQLTKPQQEVMLEHVKSDKIPYDFSFTWASLETSIGPDYFDLALKNHSDKLCSSIALKTEDTTTLIENVDKFFKEHELNVCKIDGKIAQSGTPSLMFRQEICLWQPLFPVNLYQHHDSRHMMKKALDTKITPASYADSLIGIICDQAVYNDQDRFVLYGEVPYYISPLYANIETVLEDYCLKEYETHLFRYLASPQVYGQDDEATDALCTPFLQEKFYSEIKFYFEFSDSCGDIDMNQKITEMKNIIDSKLDNQSGESQVKWEYFMSENEHKQSDRHLDIRYMQGESLKERGIVSMIVE